MRALIDIVESQGGGDDLLAQAKEYFGITLNPRECGYILPDGTMLDLSGRHQMGDYVKTPDGRWKPKRGPDFATNLRHTDHREVHDLPGFADMDLRGRDGESNPTYYMRYFLRTTGAIRFMPGQGFDVWKQPTPKQLATALAAHFTITDDPCHVDVCIGENDTDDYPERVVAREFPRLAVAPVTRFITGVLNGTITEGRYFDNPRDEPPDTSFGGWWSPVTKTIYHVGPPLSHDKWMRNRMRAQTGVDDERAYNKAMADGWVRITYPMGSAGGYMFCADVASSLPPAVRPFLKDIRRRRCRVEIENGYDHATMKPNYRTFWGSRIGELIDCLNGLEKGQPLLTEAAGATYFFVLVRDGLARVVPESDAETLWRLEGEGWEIIWDSARTVEDGYERAWEQEQAMPDDDYRPRRMASPKVLYRAVSLPELVDIFRKGQIVGGGSSFNDFEQRRWVFFGDSLEAVIGQGEDVSRQASHELRQHAINGQFRDLTERFMALAREFVEGSKRDLARMNAERRAENWKPIEVPDETWEYALAGSDSALWEIWEKVGWIKHKQVWTTLRKIEDQRNKLQNRFIDMLNRRTDAMTKAIEKKPVSSAVIETKPISGGLHYSGQHGKSAMPDADEYGFRPWTVTLSDIERVHFIKDGRVVASVPVDQVSGMLRRYRIKV